jgi:hypothetical protein
MIATTNDFFNKAPKDIRSKFFPLEQHGQTSNLNYHKATYAIELFNNGCLTYKIFISRLAKACDTDNATIHNIIEKHIVSFGNYRYKPSKKKQV